MQRLYFDVIARSPTRTPSTATVHVQWAFDDAQPWHVVVANGSTRAEPGVATDSRHDLEGDWGDWIAVSKGALDPKRAVVRRRLRFRGSPRKLRTFMQIFPRRRSKPLP